MLLIYSGRFGLPHGDAPGSRLDVQEKMVNIEAKNAGRAGVLVSIFKGESRHFYVSRRDPNGADIGQIQAYRV